MELDPKELTRYLLSNAETVGEVKGLVSQILEHYKSFNNDRKVENDKLWEALTKISENQVKGQEQTKTEIERFVKGVNEKIESNRKYCELENDGFEERFKKIETTGVRQIGFIAGISFAVSTAIALLKYKIIGGSDE